MPQPLPAFVRDRQAGWDELGELVDRAGGRVAKLDAHDVRRLGSGYRDAVADLALARRRFPGDPVTARLDGLVRRARPLVYGTVTERSSLWAFAHTGYWRRVRERPVFLLVATLVFFGPMVSMGVWAHANPTKAAQIAEVSPLSAGLADGGGRDPDTETITETGSNAAFSSQIFTNTVRVAFTVWAGGLTGGVLTLASLLFQGLLFGLIGGLAIETGYGGSLWRLIAPHGVLELSLITVAGAAGFRTGWALIRPGHRTRAEALAVEGRAGVELALGSAALLVPCGIVEGFVTPRGLSLPNALAVGFALGIAYWALVIWRGRPAPDPALTAA